MFLLFNTLGFFTGAPFAPTPQEVIDQALKLAKVSKKDIVYDLGAGDGRLLIEATKRGALAVGWEINPFLFFLTWLRVHRVSYQAEIHWGNFWKKDLGEADIVFTFILPEYMAKLEKKLNAEVKSGTKVITYLANLPNKEPIKSISGLNLYQF